MSYIYCPSKEDLGAASQTKRPTSVVVVRKLRLVGHAMPTVAPSVWPAHPTLWVS